MERLANHSANQSPDHVPFGADPGVRYMARGEAGSAAAMLTYRPRSEFEIASRSVK